MRNASIIGVLGSETWSRRSFGTTISVSTAFFSSVIPRSACVARRRPSNPNGRVDDTDRQRVEPTGDLGHDGCATGPGAATLAGGDEHHVGALEDLLDLVAVLLDRARDRPRGPNPRRARAWSRGRCRA